ncbi:protein rolling stone [Brachyhypopomus gauderio]|uniref:protein rolling stone n=1 Tax=Brachyhypopomus gauderio TaxID=698409 RepID=UPI0040412167
MGTGWTQSWAEEWKLHNLHLLPRRPELLLQPRWNIHPCVWLVYRSCMLVNIIGWCVYAALIFNTPKFLIFLSHISYVIMGLYHFVALVNLAWAFMHVRRFCQGRGKDNTMGGSSESSVKFPLPVALSFALGLQCFLHAVVGSFSLCVSFLYWAMYNSQHALTIFTINLHLVNSVQTVLDLLLSSVPVRLCHCLYTLLAATLYVGFILIYWLAGCTNLSGQPYIYSFIDFGGRPLVAALFILAVYLLGLPCFHFVLWNLQLLRERMAQGGRGWRLVLKKEVWWWASVGGRLVSDLVFSHDSVSSVFETPCKDIVEEIP